jgi:hypothetical protein
MASQALFNPREAVQAAEHAYRTPGAGQSSEGSYGAREQGHYAQEFFTVVKTAYTGS